MVQFSDRVNLWPEFVFPQGISAAPSIVSTKIFIIFHSESATDLDWLSHTINV